MRVRWSLMSKMRWASPFSRVARVSCSRGPAASAAAPRSVADSSCSVADSRRPDSLLADAFAAAISVMHYRPKNCSVAD